MTHGHGDHPASDELTRFWESRYGEEGQVWSGKPNDVLVSVAADLPPGRALDLGCGEGGDAIWLALRGWEVTGVDVSTAALARAADAARRAGVPEGRIRWEAADLATRSDGDTYDLVTAFFLHSPVEIPRSTILQRAARRVAPGGRLLVVTHAAAPSWSDAHDHHGYRFLSPDEEVAALDLDPEAWDVVVSELRRRDTTGPDGRPATLDDGVVLARRRAVAD
ncbi:Methyltransferase type 12 [Beutenbergia cavernae DSM 12333]|uniref:Methyltransferase type 12 n=1 Tax=Beutenbergia cavernae (strain ATCC BAA-8 / DSM 12333 / CCUG 43141 / JCM 11478 / NBRC 16432 / NCIMB 13614 / HKI 0122) TaxID=471853 RepID=C5C6H5_BEUC1|nr:class I SAM-dependent methyltransferase [Beutenbergia cavernae]ACQ80381.1 Methyltransferase type 12 [Beutenbergia cavernae DSM 12333]